MQSVAQFKDYVERRQESRERTSRRVTISNLAHLQQPFDGQIIDSSFSGMKLTVRTPLDVSASLAIEWEDTCALVDVVYCVEENNQYLVGVRTSYIILDRRRTPHSPEMKSRRKSN